MIETETNAVETQDGATDGQTDGNGAQDFNGLLKDKDFQSEFDRRVAKSLETARAKWKEELAAKTEEAERLASLTAEERLKEERSSFEREKLIFHAEQALTKKGLPSEFASWLCGENTEQAEQNIAKFEKQFRDAVRASVKESPRGYTPAAGGDVAERNTDLKIRAAAGLKK